MKESALTGLILLTAIRSVSACSSVSNPDNPNFDPVAENLRQAETYFYILVGLIFANVVIFFLRRKRDYLSLAIVIGLALVMIPVTILGGMDSCFYSLKSVLDREVLVFVVISVLHLGLWFHGGRLSLPFNRFNRQEMTVISLRK